MWEVEGAAEGFGDSSLNSRRQQGGWGRSSFDQMAVWVELFNSKRMDVDVEGRVWWGEKETI